jgi:hypothetical protein
MAKRGKGSRPNLKANIIREPVVRPGQRKSIRNDIPAWDNFELMYEGFQTGILMHSEYLKRLEDKDIQQAIPDQAITVAAIKKLHIGLVSIQNKLNTVHALHRNKRGDCKPDDMDLFQTTAMEYDTLRGEYLTEVEPHANIVMAQIAAAEQAVIAASSIADVGNSIKDNIIADSEDDTTEDNGLTAAPQEV